MTVVLTREDGSLERCQLNGVVPIQERVTLKRFGELFPNDDGTPQSRRQLLRKAEKGLIKVCRIGRDVWVMREDIPGEKP